MKISVPQGGLLAGLILAVLIFSSVFRIGPRPVSAWGINTKSDPVAMHFLDGCGVTFLREDINPWAPDWPERKRLFQDCRKSGKKIVGIIPYHLGLPADCDDLRVAYAKAMKLEDDAGSVVDVWENENEPDLGFDRALPDQSTAFMKAVYLGLKDAAGATKPVLLPALGLPPGPWFHRAAENDFLRYGDALNFHYYSHSRDFRSALELLQNEQVKAHASGLLGHLLPIWVTEIGLNCVPIDHPDDEAGRKRQADFFQATAQVASEMELAGYMPYALHDKPPGFSLTDSSDQPYPALAAYLETSRTLSLHPKSPWLDQSPTAPRIILQWVSAPQTAVPHKVSGTYRFPANRNSLSGELRVYSFSRQTIQGQLKLNISGDIQSPAMDASAQTTNLEIPPGALQTRKLTFSVPATGYHQGWVQAQFTEISQSSAPISSLSFGLETAPRDQDMEVLPCAFDFPPQNSKGEYAFQSIDDSYPYAVTSQVGPWLGINGLVIVDRTLGTRAGLTFSLENPSLLPGQPPMAITKVQGLPANAAFLRLTADRPWGKNVRVRVDLIDDDGQRFSIFENCGLDYDSSSPDAWLALKDFHPYVWGRFILDKPFQPQNIREIQLRFYFDLLHDPFRLQLDVLGLKKPK